MTTVVPVNACAEVFIMIMEQLRPSQQQLQEGQRQVHTEMDEASQYRPIVLAMDHEQLSIARKVRHHCCAWCQSSRAMAECLSAGLFAASFSGPSSLSCLHLDVQVLHSQGRQHHLQLLVAEGVAGPGLHSTTGTTRASVFWEAEDEHQAYAVCNPASSYTLGSIRPLLAKVQDTLAGSGLWAHAEA